LRDYYIFKVITVRYANVSSRLYLALLIPRVGVTEINSVLNAGRDEV
jgi:hypothetical protein